MTVSDAVLVAIQKYVQNLKELETKVKLLPLRIAVFFKNRMAFVRACVLLTPSPNPLTPRHHPIPPPHHNHHAALLPFLLIAFSFLLLVSKKSPVISFKGKLNV